MTGGMEDFFCGTQAANPDRLYHDCPLQIFSFQPVFFLNLPVAFTGHPTGKLMITGKIRQPKSSVEILIEPICREFIINGKVNSNRSGFGFGCCKKFNCLKINHKIAQLFFLIQFQYNP
jgi:hypothetical protein